MDLEIDIGAVKTPEEKAAELSEGLQADKPSASRRAGKPGRHPKDCPCENCIEKYGPVESREKSTRSARSSQSSPPAPRAAEIDPNALTPAFFVMGKSLTDRTKTTPYQPEEAQEAAKAFAPVLNQILEYLSASPEYAPVIGFGMVLGLQAAPRVVEGMMKKDGETALVVMGQDVSPKTAPDIEGD